MMNILYQYKDYRLFIKDSFAAKKKANPAYSYRAFNRQAGIKSPSFLSLVIQGKRNLAEDGIRKITKGFQLKEAEANYFRCLVYFNQATTHEEKDEYFRQLMSLAPHSQGKVLTEAEYSLFSHWYYVAILELLRVDSPELKNEAWIKKRIHPQVDLKDINKALKDLCLLGLLEKNAKGYLRKEENLHTSDELQDLSFVNYHRQMLHLALRSIGEVEQENRELSALTIAVSRENFFKIKLEIQKFRKGLHKILENNPQHHKELVAQVNLQLFPLTRIRKIV